jgi:hypothetical protein
MVVAQVTQIPCGCSDTTGAPDGCLQYYSGISGNIKSFNYDNVGCYINNVSGVIYAQSIKSCIRLAVRQVVIIVIQ